MTEVIHLALEWASFIIVRITTIIIIAVAIGTLATVSGIIAVEVELFEKLVFVVS